MKKLINAVGDVVREQLEGIAVAHADLVRVYFDPNYIVRAGAPVSGKVALVSGGGSGHEPLHGGFVGMGMLDGACPGEVFTSPTPDQIYACGQPVNGGAGVLLIIKNYTGDVLSFETAAELLNSDGVAVRTVVVDDDVAVKDSLYTAGRRGVGATLIVEKIAGAAAEAGLPLADVAAIARRVNLNSRSMGMALTSCIVPAVGRPTFSLGDDEMEIGIGIHGEPGQKRAAIGQADAVVDALAREILGDGCYTRIEREFNPDAGDWVELQLVSEPFHTGDKVIAFVNSMGGTPLSELYIVYRRLTAVSAARGIEIVRNLLGPYVTSLEMQGCSITLTRVDAELLRLWDAPVKTPALRWGVQVTVTKEQILHWLRNTATILADNKTYLTDLDAAIGDADHGANIARGFAQVVEKLATTAGEDLGAIFKTTGMTLMSAVGGASGMLYGNFFLRAANVAAGKASLTPDEFAQVLAAGVEGIIQRGRAAAGDKTMVDAWLPAVAAIQAALNAGQALSTALNAGAAAAEEGMRGTTPMQAKKGRASYLGERSIGHQDPGATSTYLIVRALADEVK